MIRAVLIAAAFAPAAAWAAEHPPITPQRDVDVTYATGAPQEGGPALTQRMRWSVATGRLRHVAQLAVAAGGYSFAVHGRLAPAAEIQVELRGPNGDQWVWGAPQATDRVTGDALDFCLVTTQRRHRADTEHRRRVEERDDLTAQVEHPEHSGGHGRDASDHRLGDDLDEQLPRFRFEA